MKWFWRLDTYRSASICPSNYGGAGSDPSKLPRWFLQWLMDWTFPQPGGSILSSMSVTWKGLSSPRSSKGKSNHHLLWWLREKRSMKWRRFSGIRGREPSICTWWCGRDIPSLRRVGSLNRISAMLLSSWRITCAASVFKINADNGLEETKEAVDGGPGVKEASGAFNNDGPTLVDEVSAGGNRVQRAETMEKLV